MARLNAGAMTRLTKHPLRPTSDLSPLAAETGIPVQSGGTGLPSAGVLTIMGKRPRRDRAFRQSSWVPLISTTRIPGGKVRNSVQASPTRLDKNKNLHDGGVARPTPRSDDRRGKPADAVQVIE